MQKTCVQHLPQNKKSINQNPVPTRDLWTELLGVFGLFNLGDNKIVINRISSFLFQEMIIIQL
jgi:hypothetical protein